MSRECNHEFAGTDAEDVIRNAFGCFDPDATGLIDEDRFVFVLFDFLPY